MIQGTLNKMELFKPSRFNTDKCINVLMGTRNTATFRNVVWAVIFWLDQTKFNKSSLNVVEDHRGSGQGHRSIAR